VIRRNGSENATKKTQPGLKNRVFLAVSPIFGPSGTGRPVARSRAQTADPSLSRGFLANSRTGSITRTHAVQSGRAVWLK